MATSIDNIDKLTVAQEAINATPSILHSLKAFSVEISGESVLGDGVLVPVVTAGTSATATNGAGVNFLTDGSSTIELVEVKITESKKQQAELTITQFAKLGQFFPRFTESSVNAINNDVVASIYGALTETAYTGTVVVSSWSESAPTLKALYSLVEKAKGTGKINPNDVYVLMPSSTYASLKADLDSLPREAALGFTVVPVYASGFAKTAIMDKSALAVGFGADQGFSNEEFSYVANAADGVGYGIHIIEDPKARLKTLAIVANYGFAVTNANGLLWASAT